MEKKEQIEIITELLRGVNELIGVNELNDDYGDGWDKDIENGQRLLAYLEAQPKTVIEFEGDCLIPWPTNESYEIQWQGYKVTVPILSNFVMGTTYTVTVREVKNEG